MSGYMRHDAVEVLEMDEEVILLNKDSFTVTKLNETGGFVWDSLEETLTLEELEERVSGRFSADRDTVIGDLQLFLKQMTDIGLIRLAP
jgi:hypothetical protein